MPKHTLQAEIFEDGLNCREREFCHAYLMNGLDMSRTMKALGKNDRRQSYIYLGREVVKNYLKKRVEAMEKKFDVSFEDKLKYLWRLAHISTPPDATTHIGNRPDISKNCINEMNRMQGHHAPEQYIHGLKKDSDIAEGNAILESLLAKHKKEC